MKAMDGTEMKEQLSHRTQIEMGSLLTRKA